MSCKKVFFFSFLVVTFIIAAGLAGGGLFFAQSGIGEIIKLRFFIFLAAAVFFCFLVSSILAFLFNFAVKRPLKELSVLLEDVEAGNFEKRFNCRAFFLELNRLGDSANKLAESLSQKEIKAASPSQEILASNKRYLDLIGFVSHELKGILSSIILNTYNLYNEILGPVNPVQKKTLASISRNLDYLTNTVKNFLSLSRIEKGEMELNKTDIEFVSEVVLPCLEAFSQWVDEKNIQVSNLIDKDLVVNVDLGQIQIVINNLISNAIKYAVEKGSIILTKKNTNSFIEIEVYNDSKPIEEVDLDKLFKKFSRLLYRGTERIKGTGIGLFIAKEIVEAHGGKIWAEPKEKGNSFKFTLPI